MDRNDIHEWQAHERCRSQLLNAIAQLNLAAAAAGAANHSQQLLDAFETIANQLDRLDHRLAGF